MAALNIFISKNHDDLVRRLIRYAGERRVPIDTQKALFEAALEYLAATMILPEGRIEGWPKGRMIESLQSFKQRPGM